MPTLAHLLRSVTSAVGSAVSSGLTRGARRGGAAEDPDLVEARRLQPGTRRRLPRPSMGRWHRAEAEEGSSPGQSGPDATAEIDPRAIGPVRMTYNPDTDGDPDPGEIIWTWVPFQEDDGRGKDRPVLAVAFELDDSAPAGTVLAVQLTSKDHDLEAGFVSIGAGPWDGENRPSWVNIERVLRVRRGGMRREACALDEESYRSVESALRARYGWS